MTAAQLRSASILTKALTPVVVEVLIAGEIVRLPLAGYDVYRNGVELLVLRAGEPAIAEAAPETMESR